LKQSTNSKRRINIGGGLYITGTDDDLEDSSSVSSAGALREGMDVYIRLHRESKIRHIRALAEDRERFNTELWRLPGCSMQQKAGFLREFMAHYIKKDDWSSLLRKDAFLINRHLGQESSRPVPAGMVASNPRSSSGSGAKGGRDTHRDPPRRDRDRGRGRDSRRGRGGGDGYRGGGDGSRRKKFCPTRMDPKAGKCPRGRSCPEDHHCPVCDDGSFHAACDCPSFSERRAKAAQDGR